MRLPSLRKAVQSATLICILLLCWWTFHTIHLPDIWQIFRHLTFTKIGLLLLANLVVLVTLNGRWWLFLYGLGYVIPFWRLLGYRAAAFAVSYFTPGPHVGGEPLQVYLVSKAHAVPTSVSLSAVTLDKLLEMVANLVVLVASIVLILQQQLFIDAFSQRALYLTLGVLLCPFLLLLALWRGHYPLSSVLIWLHDRLPTRAPFTSQWRAHWIGTIQQSEAQVIRLWRANPAIFRWAGAISVISWGVLMGEFWYMTNTLGLGLSFTQAITLLLAMRIAILLPMPAGLGVLEASLAMATTALGLGPAAGISLSLLIRLRDVTLGMIGLWLGSTLFLRRYALQTTPPAEIRPKYLLTDQSDNW